MILSKLFRKLDFNCYECAHTWDPDCSRVRLEALWQAYKTLLPLYLMLNSASHVMRYRGLPKVRAFVSEVAGNAHRSAASLGLCFFSLGLTTCTARSWLGYFSPWSLYAGSFAACSAAILVEKDSRVRLYNVYILQLILETMAALLQDHGINGHPLGNSLLLGVSVAVHMYLSRTGGVEETNFSKWLRYIVGQRETSRPDAPGRDGSGRQEHPCHHPGSCLEFAAKQALTVGAAGTLGSLALRVARQLPQMWKLGVGDTMRKLVKTSSGQAIALGAALAGFSACYNAMLCGLRRFEKTDSVWPTLPASVAAACVANYFWPSQRLAIYAFCNVVRAKSFSVQARKYFLCVFLCLCVFATNTCAIHGRMPDELLFGHLCGMLLPLGVLKPHYVRASYLQFLNNITGNKIPLLNWSAISHMGFDSAKVYKEELKFPLDSKFISKSYKQKIWVWNLADFCLRDSVQLK